VVEFLEKHKVSLEKRRVLLDEPIKALGGYKVPIRLHGDVTAALTVSVTRE
jgi:large subunit ribosomal protein L9